MTDFSITLLRKIMLDAAREDCWQTMPRALQQVQILSQEEPEMKDLGTEVDKAQARLETAEEVLKLAQDHMLEVQKRADFYRRELRRIISETFTKGEPA